MNKFLLNRRKFLQRGAAGLALFVGVSCSTKGIMTSLRNISPLLPPDENGVRLPQGFKSRVVARSGERPALDSSHLWHGAPDGGAVYATDDGGWIYVSNSELRDGNGGVGALRFNSQSEVIDSYPILEGTSTNCAGGKTPWQTWLSCEEIDDGQVYECDPFGISPAVARPALGIFKHEAVAVDPENQLLYLTEDKPDGGFYRFRPSNPLPDLSSGTLEVARIRRNGDRQYLNWLKVPDPLATQLPTRKQVPDYSSFNGGEGLVYQHQNIYFSTKGDNRVWCYNVASSEITIIYDIAVTENPILRGVDNLSITPAGEVLVAEDLDDMQLILLTPGERAIPLLQIVGHDRSEITGPAFNPDYNRLYFSSQRGAEGVSANGITYEISPV